MRRLITALALAAVAACGGDNATNPASGSIAGTYTLRTVNGSQLPFTVQSGTNSVTLTGDVITIADGGSWSETFAYTQTINGTTTNQTGTDGGSWSRAGTSVSLDSDGGYNAYTGTFTGNSLNLTDGTLTQVFTK